MTLRIVLLDTTPLGLVSQPKPTPLATACRGWLYQAISQVAKIIIPEIADYELRRELLRANKRQGLFQLDSLIQQLEYVPLSTETMRQAALFWAQSRQQGQPTASDPALDGDVILAAQAILLNKPNVIVATENVRHISPFVSADLWKSIT